MKFIDNRYAFIVIAIGSAGGCHARVADQLLGNWVGQPDTVGAREIREASRFQYLNGSPAVRQHPQEVTDAVAKSPTSLESATSKDVPAGRLQPTDWELFPVLIRLEFAPGQLVKMSLGDHLGQRSGTWQVVEETPMGVVVEIETVKNREISSQENENSTIVQTERRRFELHLDYEGPTGQGGPCTGFRLVEVGADPRLGAIYFKREISS
jgi:hypothetical protein